MDLSREILRFQVLEEAAEVNTPRLNMTLPIA